MAMFQSQVEQVRLPDVTGLISQITNANKVNPFTSFGKTLDNYLQGQHNIGVAEAKNELLKANSHDEALNIMNNLRAKGLTETQLEDAGVQSILDKKSEIDFRKAQEAQQKLTTDIAKKNQIFLEQERNAEEIATKAKLDLEKYGSLMAPEIVQQYFKKYENNPLVLGKLLKIAPEGSLKELPAVGKNFDQYVLTAMPEYIASQEARRNEAIRQAEMFGYSFDENGNLITSKDSFFKGVDALIKSRGWTQQNADHISKEYERVFDAFKGLYSEDRLLEAARAVYDPDTIDLIGSPGSINLDHVAKYLERYGNESSVIKHLSQTLKNTQGLAKGTETYKNAKTILDTELASIDANDAPEYMKIKARERAKSKFETSIANVIKGIIALEDRMQGNPLETAQDNLRRMGSGKVRAKSTSTGKVNQILENALNKEDYDLEKFR